MIIQEVVQANLTACVEDIQLLDEDEPSQYTESVKQQVPLSISRRNLEDNLIEKSPDYENGTLGLVSNQSLEPTLHVHTFKNAMQPIELSIQPEVASYLESSYMRVVQGCQ